MRETQPHTMAAHPPWRKPASEPLVPPIYESSVYTFPSLEAVDRAFGDDASPVYSRMGNPNALALADQVARLEGAESGVAIASGQGAMLVAILAAMGPGGRLVYSPHLYGGTLALIRKWVARMAPVQTFDAWGDGPDLHEGDVLFVESLSNPLIRPTPISRLAGLALGAGATLVVDNTFATPASCRPLEHGAGIVAHSVTKSLSGHGHVILGAVVGGKELIGQAKAISSELGLAADPYASWLAAEGSRTFWLRMERAEANATALAAKLQAHRAVRTVHHPSLGADAFFREDFIGPGSVLAFDLGSLGKASLFLKSLHLIALAPSLGDVTTTVSHPGLTSHRGLSEEERATLGITPGLIRLSVGIEDVSDLWADLVSALNLVS